MRLFPLPEPLLKPHSATSSVLPVLNASATPGLANALLLSGHPFISHAQQRQTHCWSLARLEMELTRRRGVRSGTPIKGRRPQALCGAQAHPLSAKGVVVYLPSQQRLPCRALLHALRSQSRAYGVINLEEQAGGMERCLAPLRGLGASMGALHSLVSLATNGHHLSAMAMLRVGTTPPNASAYPMHFDRSENLLMQLQGSKHILLAPPSQASDAAIDAVKRSSTVDWSSRSAESTRAAHPRAARVRGLHVVMNPGDVLFIPFGWLHTVLSSAAPSAEDGDDGSTCSQRRKRRQWPLPWLSLNLFFTSHMRPTFKLFDSCDPAALRAELARMPKAHVAALSKLGMMEAVEAYCATPTG